MVFNNLQFVLQGLIGTDIRRLDSQVVKLKQLDSKGWFNFSAPIALSQTHFHPGGLLTTDSTLINAVVLLVKVLKLVSKLELEQEQRWVIYTSHPKKALRITCPTSRGAETQSQLNL